LHPSQLDELKRNKEYWVYCCPKCQYRGFKTRKHTKPLHRCVNQKCNHEFENPNKRPDQKNPEVIEIIDSYVRKLKLKHADSISKLVEIERQKQHERYMSCKDTITCCQKCAYLEDVKGIKLCAKCKKNWHKASFSVCYECDWNSI